MKTLIELLARHARTLAFPVLFGALATAAFSNSLFEISSSIFLGLWLVDLIARRRTGVFRGAWPLLLAVYVLVNALSVLPAQFAYDSLKGAFRVLRWALLTLAVTDIVDTEEKLSLGFQAILAVIVFIAVDALVQGATGVEILRGRSMTAFYGDTRRVTGPFPHTNDFSAYLCLAVFAFAAAAAASKGRGARLFFVLAGLTLALACLALTYSRGAWLAVVLAFLLWAALRRSVWPVALVALFAAGAYLQSPFLFAERMRSLASFGGGTVSERRILWSESVDMIRAKPLLGFGVNTYSRNVAAFKDPTRPTDRQYAHNGYLQIAAETGLLGLASFLAAVFCFFASTARSFFVRKPGETEWIGQGIWLGLAAFLVQSATDTTLQSLLLCALFWMWTGLGWSAHRLHRRA